MMLILARSWLGLILLAGGSGSGFAAGAAQPEAGGGPAAAKAAGSPRAAEFLQIMHAVNQAEIDAGKLAQSQGQSQAIKDYGKVLEDDHKELDQRLTALAAQLNVDVAPKAPAADVKRETQKLDTMAGELKKAPKDQFDHQFATSMVQGHQDAISLVKKARAELKGNAGIETLAGVALPVLEKHEDMARRTLEAEKAMAH